MKLILKPDLFARFCPECQKNESIFDHSKGNVICGNCGLILESIAYDLGAEWRAFNTDEYSNRARNGLPASYCIHDKGLSTMIDWRDVDANGKKLSPNLKAQAHRLRKWHIRSQIQSSFDRNLTYAMSELERLCSQLSLSYTFKESAARIYRKTVHLNLIKGRSIDAMIGACIYIVCRQFHFPCKLEEIANKSRIGFHDLGRCYRIIIRKLNLQIPTTTANQFISRYSNDLQISTKAQTYAIKILNFAKKFGITAGKDPSSLAAASIYVAALENGERKTQKQIAKVASVTEVTVRNRYKELVKCLNLKIPH